MWARVFPVSWTTLLVAWPAGGPNFGSEAVWRASGIVCVPILASSNLCRASELAFRICPRI